MRDTEKVTGRDTDRDTDRGRSRLHAGSPMWDLIPGPQDHALGRRHAPNPWASQASFSEVLFLNWVAQTDLLILASNRPSSLYHFIKWLYQQLTDSWFLPSVFLFFFFFRFYLFIHERDTERGRDTGRGKSRLCARSPMRDLIPGPQDHALSWKQMLNHWAIQASLLYFLKEILFIYLRERDSKWEAGGWGQRERET